MSLKDSLVKPEKFKPRSWLDQMKEELSPEDFDWLIDCINNPKDFSGMYLSTKLTELGYPVSVSTINNLRKANRG